MLPYFKVPIVLAGDIENQAEVPDKTVSASIQPAEISAFQPGYHWGSFIYMKMGHVFCTSLTCDQLEVQLKKYWEQVKRDVSRPVLYQ